MNRLPSFPAIAEAIAKNGFPVSPGNGLQDQQKPIFDAVVNKSPKQHTFVIGGSFGGGKTWMALVTMVTLCFMYPGSRMVVIRETTKSCRESVFADFRSYFSRFCKRILNQNTSPVAEFHNGSQIIFKGVNAKEDPNFNEWKSYNITAAFIEQLEDIPEGFYEILLGRIGRWKPNGCPEFVLCSVNPCPDWPLTRFWLRWRENRLPDGVQYFPMHISKNEYLFEKEGYMERFEDMSETMKRAFLDGDWSIMLTDDFGQLYPNDWINKAVEKWKECNGVYEPISSIGNDVARGGKDETAFALRCGNIIREIYALPGVDTPDGKRLIHALTDLVPKFEGIIVMDLIGVGSSPYDKARELWGERVLGFVAGAKGYGTTENGLWGFSNRKAQAYWYFRERMNPNKPDSLGIPDDPILLSQLRAIRFKIKGDKIVIADKDQMRKEYGFSPDRAEAAILSLFSETLGITEGLLGW